MQTLRDLGSAKLSEAEQECIRHAADSLLFSDDSDECRAVGADVAELCQTLVDSGRLSQERTQQLILDLADCGPLQAPSQA